MPDGIFRVINASYSPLPNPKRHSAFDHSFSVPKRQLDAHHRALSRLAFPLHLGTDFSGSFADADAAEVAGLAMGLGGGVEALAVVGDAQR